MEAREQTYDKQAVDLLLSYILNGEEHARSRRELMKLTNMADRDLRRLIEHIRREGICVASSNQGYYFPDTIAEIHRYISREEGRARSIFYTLRAARMAEQRMLNSVRNAVSERAVPPI